MYENLQILYKNDIIKLVTEKSVLSKLPEYGGKVQGGTKK